MKRDFLEFLDIDTCQKGRPPRSGGVQGRSPGRVPLTSMNFRSKLLPPL